MANVMKALKDEIARIARIEINTALKPIKSVNASQRKYIADLRRQVALLEKDNKQLQKAVLKVPDQEVAEEEAPRGWITSQGIRSMRTRLRLSQRAFAELAGVSLPTVANWEGQKKGKLSIRRKEVLARLFQIKTMGVREARQILGM